MQGGCCWLCSQGEEAAWWCSETSAPYVPCDVCNKQCHNHAEVTCPQWGGTSLAGELWLQLESSALVRQTKCCSQPQWMGMPELVGRCPQQDHQGLRSKHRLPRPWCPVCIMGRDGQGFSSPDQRAFFHLLRDSKKLQKTKATQLCHMGTGASLRWIENGSCGLLQCFA